jgi:hypothetical protein
MQAPTSGAAEAGITGIVDMAHSSSIYIYREQIEDATATKAKKH